MNVWDWQLGSIIVAEGMQSESFCLRINLGRGFFYNYDFECRLSVVSRVDGLLDCRAQIFDLQCCAVARGVAHVGLGCR